MKLRKSLLRQRDKRKRSVPSTGIHTESWGVRTGRQGPEKLLGVVEEFSEGKAALFCGEDPLIGMIAEEKLLVVCEKGALSEDMFC